MKWIKVSFAAVITSLLAVSAFAQDTTPVAPGPGGSVSTPGAPTRNNGANMMRRAALTAKGSGTVHIEGRGGAMLEGEGTIKVKVVKETPSNSSDQPAVAKPSNGQPSSDQPASPPARQNRARRNTLTVQGFTEKSREGDIVTYTGKGTLLVYSSDLLVDFDGTATKLTVSGTGSATFKGDGSYTAAGKDGSWSKEGDGAKVSFVQQRRQRANGQRNGNAGDTKPATPDAPATPAPGNGGNNNQ